jgi:hypothetical protein
MLLTPQQDAVINAWVLADAELGILEPSSDAINKIIDKLGTLTVPNFKVWRTLTSVSDISDAIIWANFTPSNPSAGGGTDVTNWLLACQGKQFNLQTLLSGREYVNTSKPNIRAGLQDALTQVPSGVSGANKQAGWPAVQLVIQKVATNFERLFATGTGTEASPGNITLEGLPGYYDVLRIIGW